MEGVEGGCKWGGEGEGGEAVRKIELNKKEYEVELTNGIDLTFNKHFQLIDID